MRRLLPSLPLSFVLFVFWLLLNDSAAPADLLAGAIVAVLAPALAAPLKPAGPKLRKPLVLAHLVLRVGADVVVSALQVAAGILRTGRRPPRGSFVAVPLDLKDPHGLAALAMITAVVPGTVWCELAADRSRLLLHVFDLADEADFIVLYKRRYELPLTEIFG